MSQFTHKQGSTTPHTYTLSFTPSGAPVTTIYSDAARTIAVGSPITQTSTANPAAWNLVIPGTVTGAASGTTYYLGTVSPGAPGGGSFSDNDDTMVVYAPSGSFGGTLAQVSDVRTSANDTTTSPLAYLWRNLSDAQLLTHLTRASAAVESIVSARLAPFTVTEDLPCTLDADIPAGVGLTFTIPTLPPQNHDAWSSAINTVQLLDPYASAVSYVTVTATIDYDISTGKVRFNAQALPDARVARVTYTGGFSPVPADLVEATILLAADAFVVGVDARDGQQDAADLYSRAMTRLAPWMKQGATLGFA